MESSDFVLKSIITHLEQPKVSTFTTSHLTSLNFKTAENLFKFLRENPIWQKNYYGNIYNVMHNKNNIKFFDPKLCIFIKKKMVEIAGPHREMNEKQFFSLYFPEKNSEKNPLDAKEFPYFLQLSKNDLPALFNYIQSKEINFNPEILKELLENSPLDLVEQFYEKSGIKLMKECIKNRDESNWKVLIECCPEKFLKKIDDEDPALSSHVKQLSRPIVQIESTPLNRHALLHNLDLVIKQFPKLAFGNDLAVYDTAKGSLPLETNIIAIRERLNNERSNLASEEETTIEIAIDSLMALYKVQTAIPLGICIEKTLGGDNGALRDNVRNGIKENMPVILNKMLLHCHLNEFEKIFQGSDIYVQHEGSFILVLPKGSDPQSLGFNFHSSERWSKSVADITNTPLKFDDISTMLLDQHQEKNFHRTIAFSGHGGSLYYTEPHIAGLKVDEFQQALKILTEKKMAFLSLHTCFGGGENAHAIKLTDDTIPCPTVIFSSTENVAIIEPGYLKILDKIQNKLFDPVLSNQIPLPAQALTKKWMSMRVNKTTSPYPVNNMNSFLLPKNRSDIPSIVQILPDATVCDIAQELKNNPKEILVEKEVLIFSDAVVETPIVWKEPNNFILLSRGGRSHTAIKNLDIISDKLTLEDFAIFIFNSTHPDLRHIDKNCSVTGYFIGTLKINDQVFENVAIDISPTSRRIVFRNQGEENFQQMVFKNNPPAVDWDFSSQSNLSIHNAIGQIYELIKETRPQAGKNAHRVNQSEQDFFAHFTSCFWQGRAPSGVDIFQVLPEDVYPDSFDIERLKSALYELKGEEWNLAQKTLTQVSQRALLTKEVKPTSFSHLSLRQLQTLFDTEKRSGKNPRLEAIKETVISRQREILSTPMKIDSMLEKNDFQGLFDLFFNNIDNDITIDYLFYCIKKDEKALPRLYDMLSREIKKNANKKLIMSPYVIEIFLHSISPDMSNNFFKNYLASYLVEDIVKNSLSSAKKYSAEEKVTIMLSLASLCPVHCQEEFWIRQRHLFHLVLRASLPLPQIERFLSSIPPKIKEKVWVSAMCIAAQADRTELIEFLDARCPPEKKDALWASNQWSRLSPIKSFVREKLLSLCPPEMREKL